MEVQIEDIQSNFENILQLLGSESYVDWDAFLKSSTELNKQVEQLMSSLAVFKDIQQKRFISSMKKMKKTDIPDLIKTVKAKKLPKEALKSITSQFTKAEGKIQLKGTAENLKEESKKHFSEYLTFNSQITKVLQASNTILQQKIKSSQYVEQTAPTKELVSTFKHHFSQEKIQQVCKTISIQIQPGTTDFINIQTYGQIVQKTQQVVKDQYLRLTLEARDKQRKLLHHPQSYAAALVEYLTNSEVLILEGQRAIVRSLGLTQQKVEGSEVHLMEKGLAQTILLLQSGLRTSIKQSIKSDNPVDFEKTKEIIKFQVAMIKEHTPFFKSMLGSMEKTPENFQILPLIIALTLNDFVWQKFGYQEEDFMKSMTDQVVMTKPEVSSIFKEMEKAIIILMKDSGVINEDMAKVMEMQSQHIQNQLSEMGLGSLPTGIFPGSSPNDLLQQQQKNQFEQMKKR